MTKEEFSDCFQRYFDPIRNYIAYRCGDSELATDICQETFMLVWKKQLEYRPESIKGLLYKIAKDLWVTQYRKQLSARSYSLTLSYADGLDHQHPERSMEYRELKERYETALGNLPAKQRQVFLMSRLDQMTYKEIAITLGIGVKAVEKRMTLALGTLRKTLVYEK